MNVNKWGAARFAGHEVLGLNGPKITVDTGVLQNGSYRQGSEGGSLPTPMGFRALSPAYDIWTLDASPTSNGGSRRMVFSPTSMLNGLEPFSPTTIREVSDLNDPAF